jgi:hypothetical protein
MAAAKKCKKCFAVIWQKEKKKKDNIQNLMGSRFSGLSE